jgi:hypothetical protein
MAANNGGDPEVDPDHPQYLAGLRAAHNYLVGGVGDNPFNREDIGDLPSATRAEAGASLPRTPQPAAANATTPAATAPAPARRPAPVVSAPAAATAQPSAATALIAAEQPLIDEKARKSAGISPADWARRSPANDPFKNGFFVNTAANGGLGAGAALPRRAPVSADAPVGGTSAVLSGGPAIRAPGDSGTLRVAADGSSTLESPYGSGSARFDSTPGTRKPFIGGANGENVAGQFANPNDRTLDPNYAKTIPLPRQRNQRALASGG